MGHRKFYSGDPRVITAKFTSYCAETGTPIYRGEECVYYPLTGKVFSFKSRQAREFGGYMADLDMGANY